MSIPASQFVNIIPGVVGVGGAPLSLNAIFVDEDTSIPIGTVQGFPSLTAVQNWYGATSNQATLAAVYFGGFNGCQQLPGKLYFTQYNTAAVAGYMRGGSVSALTLSQLQALSGTITIAVNGDTITSATINLASATSQSNAAALIQTGLQQTGNVFSGTITTTSGSASVTVDATTSGELHIGDTLVSADLPADTTILSFGTYTTTSGTGTITVSANATASAGPTAATVTLLPTVTYDTLRQAFVITSPTTGASSSVGYGTDTSLSPSLYFTQATGAVLSPGAAAATPAGVMNQAVTQTQNWFSFMTTFQPTQSVMEAFATWVNGMNQRYLYVNWDSNVLYTEAPPQPTLYAQIVLDYNGCATVYDSTGTIAAFVCGAIASIAYTATNGYAVLAGKSSSLLTPNVTNQTTYQNIVANGASCYADVATANATFQWFQNGQVSGNWDWIDEYAFQVWLNSQLQLAGANLINTVKNIPYNSTGIGMQQAAFQPAIQQGVDFGGIQTGITLTGAQQVAINTAAGATITNVLYQTGWYLQISLPSPAVQGQRGPMPSTLWYTNAGGVQQITLNSLNVQ